MCSCDPCWQSAECKVYFWVFYSIPLVHTCVFLPEPYSFNCCSFSRYFEMAPALLSCPKMLWPFGVFYGSIHILGIFSISIENETGVLMGIVLTLNHLGWWTIFYNINSSNPVTEHVFTLICVSLISFISVLSSSYS